MSILNPYENNFIFSSSGSDSYSTEEQLIGTWINGKPIYRKVFQMTITDSVNTNAVYSVASLNIDFMVSMKGTCRAIGGNKHIYFLTVPYAQSGYVVTINYDQTTNNVQLMHINAEHNSMPVMVFIEYTKTTDEATVELPASFANFQDTSLLNSIMDDVEAPSPTTSLLDSTMDDAETPSLSEGELSDNL